MSKPVRVPDMIEGPKAFERFSDAMKEIVSVSKDELEKRLKKYNEDKKAKPRRRAVVG